MFRPSTLRDPPDAANDAARHCGPVRHVLVVEDSPMIASDIARILRSLGVASIKVAHNLADAIEAIDARLPDLAILDTDLGDTPSTPIASALTERSVRFVMAAGYAQSFEPDAAKGASGWLNKPFGRTEIGHWVQL